MSSTSTTTLGGSTTSSRPTRTLAGIPTSVSYNTDTADFPFNTSTYGSPGNGGGGGGGGGVNSTLYLFTFLTTLLLLLAVSCGIVVRSFVLRRRFHRRVEEAIAAGVLLPSQTGDIAMGPGGSISVYRRPLGEKPKMWEVWINERAVNNPHSSLISEWSKIQPVAATRYSDAPPNPQTESSLNEPVPAPPATTFARLANRLPFGLGQGRSRRPTGITPASPEVPLPTLAYGASPAPGHHALEPLQASKSTKPSNSSGGENSIQVAVLIAMPDPSKPRYTPGASPIDSHTDTETSGIKGKQRSSELPSVLTEEHELPEICIGVAQAQVVNPTQITSTSTPHNSPKPV